MINPIKTRRQHKAALKRIDELMDAEAGTPEAAELKALAVLIEAYERKHFSGTRSSARAHVTPILPKR